MAYKKKALITGASSGIGKATAMRFALEGYDVCLNARRRDKLEAMISEMPKGNHLICDGDYSLTGTAEKISNTIKTRWKSLDVFVNCAGIFSPVDAVNSTVEKWREIFDMMINGALYVTRAVVPLMKQDSRIIFVTSIHGDRAEKAASAYSMAKSALNQYCRSLALELAPKGILVNAIAPGFIDTAMSVVNGVNELETEWFRNNYMEGHHLPLKRAGKPEEIAGVAFFLAGHDSTYITGQVIIVDGGLTITF